MTLEDFINVRKNGEKECKRINIYLKQVLLEKIAKLESKDEAKEVPRAEVSEDTVSNRRAVSHQQASSSEVSEEVKYFANLESKQSCSPEFVERVEADLDIFNYNFEDEPEMLWDKTPSSR